MHIQSRGRRRIAPHFKYLPVCGQVTRFITPAGINGKTCAATGSTEERWRISFYNGNIRHGDAGDLLWGRPDFIEEKGNRTASPSGLACRSDLQTRDPALQVVENIVEADSAGVVENADKPLISGLEEAADMFCVELVGAASGGRSYRYRRQ